MATIAIFVYCVYFYSWYSDNMDNVPVHDVVIAFQDSKVGVQLSFDM